MAVTAYRVKKESSLPPIGKVVDNTKLYVVDEDMHLLPPVGIGELCISGLQVGKGYLNRSEKTGEVFVSNPFSAEDGYERLYRTGDVVRYLSPGDIDFVGRRDGQVKVRGSRIELMEIEKVIRGYEGIKDACVTAFDSLSGGKSVCAYIVSDAPVDVFSLESFIKTKLPSYMVSSVTMQIDRIPLTVNQKVDRRALPPPVFEQKKEYEAPGTDAGEDFEEAFRKVLELEKVGGNDDFFSLGGSSISAMKVVVEAYLALGEIPYSAMDEETDLSPVDSTAESILLLSSTPDECICFMPSNPYLRHLGNLLSDIDSSVMGVEDDVFSRALSLLSMTLLSPGPSVPL